MRTQPRPPTAGFSPVLTWRGAPGKCQPPNLSLLLGIAGIIVTVTSPAFLLHPVQARAGSRHSNHCHHWDSGEPGGLGAAVGA